MVSSDFVRMGPKEFFISTKLGIQILARASSSKYGRDIIFAKDTIPQQAESTCEVSCLSEGYIMQTKNSDKGNLQIKQGSYQS